MQSPPAAHRYRSPWTLALAITFIVEGLFLIAFFGQVITLTCNRIIPSIQSNCQLVETNLLQSNVTRFPANKLQGAKVGKISMDNGESDQILLLTSKGEVSFSRSYMCFYPLDDQIVNHTLTKK